MTHLDECPNCSSQLTRFQEDHKYVESGLKNIKLKDTWKYQCSNELKCGKKFVKIQGLDELHLVIGLTIILQPNELIGKEVRFLRKHLGLSLSKLSEKIQLEPTAIGNWENGADIDLKFDTLLRKHYFKELRHNISKIPDIAAIFTSVASGLPQCVNPIVCNKAERAQVKCSDLTLGFLISLQPNELKGTDISFLRDNLKLSQEDLANTLDVSFEYLSEAENIGKLKREEEIQLRTLFINAHKTSFMSTNNVTDLFESIIEHLPQCNFRTLCGRPYREVYENLWRPQEAMQNSMTC